MTRRSDHDFIFDAPLWQHDGPGGWHFVTLPDHAAEWLRDVVPPTPGFGSVRVTASIGRSTWRTSAFPDAKSRSYVLPVKQQARRANDLVAGDVVTVTLHVDA